MVMNITDIQLFQILKEKIGEKEAEALVNFVDYKLKESNENNLKILAAKSDIGNVKEAIENFYIKISSLKSDVLGSLFVCFIVLATAILGLYFKK